MQNKDLWQDFYENDMERPFGERRLADSRLDIVFSNVVKYARIKKIRPLCYLDIGFTDGYLLKKAAQTKFFQVYGLDIAQRAIERVESIFKKAGLAIGFKQGSITKIPFPDNFFDVITSCEVFEHLDGENLGLGFLEVRRVLKEGGILVVTSPFKENVLSAQTTCPACSLRFNPNGHQQSFDEEKWKNLLLRYNFKLLMVQRIYGTDFRLQRLSWGLPFIKLAARLFQVDSLTKLLVIAQK